MIAFAKPDNIIAMPQKSNEWYTPARYIEAARAVMGSIDLDPASCELANRTVKATRFYTAKENGLEQPWYGRVWLNPPFGNIPFAINAPWQGASRSGLFVRRLVWEFEHGNIEQAVLLAKADPKQNWFQPLWDYLICFARDNVYFLRPDSIPTRIQFGTCFVYFGSNEQAFIDAFSKFGRVARAIDTPRQTVTSLSLWEVH